VEFVTGTKGYYDVVGVFDWDYEFGAMGLMLA